MSWVGRKLIIRKDGVAIAGARAKSVRFNNDPIDVTYEEEDGFRHLLDVLDTREIVISIEGVLSAPHIEQLIRPKLDGELIDIEVEFPDESLIAGDAYIQSLQITGEYRNAVMFSASLVLSGEIGFSASPACGPTALLFSAPPRLPREGVNEPNYRYGIGWIDGETLEHVSWRGGGGNTADVFPVGHADNPHAFPVMKWNRRSINAVSGNAEAWQELLIATPQGYTGASGSLSLYSSYLSGRLMAYLANTSQSGVVVTGWLFDRVFYPGPLDPFFGPTNGSAVSASTTIIDVPGWGVYVVGAGSGGTTSNSCGISYYPRANVNALPAFTATAGIHIDNSAAVSGSRSFIGSDSEGRVYFWRTTTSFGNGRLICLAPGLTGIVWEVTLEYAVDYVPGQQNSIAADNNFNFSRLAVVGNGSLLVAGGPIMSVLDISEPARLETDLAGTLLGLVYVGSSWIAASSAQYRAVDNCRVWFPNPANAMWNISADGLAPT